MRFRSFLVLLFSLLVFLSGSAAQADLINFISPAVAQPASSQAGNGNIFNAYSMGLANYAGWDDVLTLTMNAQDFAPSNGWSRDTVFISLASDASFNIKRYETHAELSSGGVSMMLVLDLGATTTPVNGVFHWLQLVQTNRQVQTSEGAKPFGFNIVIAPGFWQLDNGQKSAGPGIGPFYDSNGF